MSSEVTTSLSTSNESFTFLIVVIALSSICRAYSAKPILPIRRIDLVIFALVLIGMSHDPNVN